MEEIAKKCVKNLKHQFKKAGHDISSLTDEQIWSIWYTAYSESVKESADAVRSGKLSAQEAIRLQERKKNE